MAITFESPVYPTRTIVRPDETTIDFVDSLFVAHTDEDIAQLRAHPHLIERGAHAMKMESTPLAPRAAAPSPKIDLNAFPFDRRVYQRGNEPFVVLHVSPLLGPVADGVREIVAAFGEAFPDESLPKGIRHDLRIVTGGARVDVGAPVVERELTDRVLLDLYREAHVVVRTSAEAGDAFAVKAVAAGTPVIEGGDFVRALRDAEASYVRLSAEAAKAAKKLRAGR